MEKTLVPLERSASRLGGRRSALVAGAIAIVAVLAVVFWPWSLGGPGGGREELISAGAMRVAVLPFAPHGEGSGDRDLSVSVAQLVSVNLETVGASQVVPHRAVLEVCERYGCVGGTVFDVESLSAISDELGATSLVVGDVHASGDQLRIVAELVGGGTATALARADVRGPRDSLFALLDELAGSLAESVQAMEDTARVSGQAGGG